MKKYYEFINNIPEIININGHDKPTINSNGDFIYHTIEGIINFWNWFDDSVVIDNLGRPLIMYHGTQYDFDIFNTDNELGAHFGNIKHANHITSHKVGKKYFTYPQNYLIGQSVIPVYLSIKKFRRESSGNSYIVFFPNQIKSKYNIGNFDKNKLRIDENN